MRLYVASSWRNPIQPGIVEALRRAGHEVYDFRHPAPGNEGFKWSAIDPEWQQWTPDAYRQALEHPIAKAGFKCDFDAMKWAEACVLVRPCGASAHTEAGWMSGAGKPVVVYQPDDAEPELMYRLFGARGAIVTDLVELLEALVRAEHVIRCTECGADVDRRDLTQVMVHMHHGPVPVHDGPPGVKVR